MAAKRRRRDLGPFARDSSSVSPAVARAAFAVQGAVGLAPVFQDGDRWVVLVKTGELAGFEAPFERVEKGIRRRLRDARRDQLVDKVVDALIARTPIAFDDDALARVRGHGEH